MSCPLPALCIKAGISVSTHPHHGRPSISELTLKPSVSAMALVGLIPSRSCTEHVSATDAGLRGSIQRAKIGRGEKEADQPVQSGCMQDMREWKRRIERGRAKGARMKMLNAREMWAMWLGAKLAKGHLVVSSKELALSNCSLLESAQSPDFPDFEWSFRTLTGLE